MEGKMVIIKMKYSYYKGYKAQQYDDEYSLRDYCKRCKKCCYNDSDNSSTTTFVEEEGDGREPPNSIAAFLRIIFCCW